MFIVGSIEYYYYDSFKGTKLEEYLITELMMVPTGYFLFEIILDRYVPILDKFNFYHHIGGLVFTFGNLFFE